MTKIQPLVLCVSLALPAAAWAQESSSRPQPPFELHAHQLFGGATTTQSGAYFNLAPRRTPAAPPGIQVAPAPRQGTRLNQPPRVVCGMTIVPADPAVDPGMTARVTPPAARPTIRAVEPAICGADPR